MSHYLTIKSTGGVISVPKRFKGTQNVKNYHELCSFLKIEAAPRGAAREQQLEDLRKTYDITKHKSGRYDITYLTQIERDHRNGVAGGWIQTIDGVEVNLKSPQCYRHTGIDAYILCCALTTDTETMRDFQLLCFHQCSYFHKLLNKRYSGDDGLNFLQDQYDTFILTKADELIEGRLDDRVDYLLEKLEKDKYIKLDRFYRLSNGSIASLDTVQPYVDQALHELGHRNEYYACRSKASREDYFQKRNELYQAGEQTDLKIVRKELHIIPLLTFTDDRYPKFTQEQQSETLTHFFNVFRAKLLYDLKTPGKIDLSKVPTRLKKGIQNKSVEQSIAEVIEKYCTYETCDNEAFDIKRFNYYAVSGLEDTVSEFTEG